MVLAAGVVMSGCARKERPHFEPTHPVVGWAELSGGHDVAVAEGFRLLVAEPTKGVFPTSIAVARLAATAEVNGAEVLALDTRPEVDFLAWNSCFDDLRPVSEVFPVNARAMNGEAIAVPTLLDNAAALRAGMILAYSEERQTPQRYELRGVLYEVATRRALASLHAIGFVQAPVAPDEEYAGDDPADHFERVDPRELARKEFRQYARECLLALMAKDEAAEPVAPEGWIPDRPIEPLLWPPLDDLRRRYGDEYQR